MAERRAQPEKRRIIDALVLAFSNSAMSDIVGTDALRSVISVEYMDIVESGSFELQQVWDLLEQQPGFEPEGAKPPMCLFKSWEKKLGMDVVLPKALEGLNSREQALLAAGCRVTPAERDRVFPSSDTPEKKKRKRKKSAAIVMTEAPAGDRARLSRPGILGIASLVSVVCFTLAGFSVVKWCRGPQWTSIAASDFAGELPIKNAKRMGSQVGATLTDANWVTQPPDTRRSQMEAALRRLEGKQIQVLFVKDADGRIRATAQLVPDERTIQVRFQ